MYLDLCTKHLLKLLEVHSKFNPGGNASQSLMSKLETQSF